MALLDGEGDEDGQGKKPRCPTTPLKVFAFCGALFLLLIIYGAFLTSSGGTSTPPPPITIDDLNKRMRWNEYESRANVTGGRGGAVFRRRREIRHVDCERVLRNDEDYMEELARSRSTLVQDPNLNMTCDAIRSRLLPPRNPDTAFPVLFAKIVYQNYDFLEDQLATMYAAENTYCFAVDNKTEPVFRAAFAALEQCLPNVIVARINRSYDSGGHNQNEAHLECMRATRERKWEYAILMQNNDVIIKTHTEITEILRIYGGANDVEIYTCRPDRCLPSFETNLGKLQLCPKSLRGEQRAACERATIEWGKGSMQAMISRAAADFIFDEINVTPLVAMMNNTGYGVDEQLYATLQITPEIGLPGGFHAKCRGKQSQYVTREVLWRTERGLFASIKHWFKKECRSGFKRHSVCVFGLEDLPYLAASKSVMANKMMPDFDHAITSCLSELLFNRTRDGISTINRQLYEQIDMVRYHRESKKPGFRIDDFQCEL